MNKQTAPTQEHSRVLLHLLLLFGLAIAQPLYSLLGANPEFLVAHRLKEREFLIFVLTLSFIIPSLLFLLHYLISKLSRQLAGGLLVILIAGLVSLVTLPVIIRIFGSDDTAALLIAGVSGAITAWFYFKAPSLRQFLTVFSVAAVVFPINFIFFSPASGLLASEPSGISGDHVRIGRSPPVIFLVFDEFPLISILDSNMQIDAGRFPNLASLTQDAVFYRNHTSNSNSTLVSVPNMLSGNLPNGRNRGLPSLNNYPDNLFRLLGNHYEIEATEHGTRLCPEQFCGEQPAFIRLLVSDTLIVIGHILAPPSLQERLPVINNDWLNFANAPSPADVPVQDTAFFKQTLNWDKRIVEVDTFISELEAGEGKLNYFHAMLPHASWQYMPDGRTITASPSGHILGSRPNNPDLPFKHMWFDSPDAVRVSRQRHLLQTGYVDTLIGRLIKRLKDREIYDESLLIITSDHGASFKSGGARRDTSDSDLPEVAAVPLLIKYPGNSPSGLSLANAQLMDVVPTILDVLDANGWDAMDGQSLLDKDREDDRDKAVFFSGRGTKNIQLPEYESLLAQQVHEFTEVFGEGGFESIYSAGDQHNLVGKQISDIDIQTGTGPLITIENDQLIGQRTNTERFLQMVVHGKAQNGPSDIPSNEIAISTNGVIRSVTGLLDIPGYENSFETLLPLHAFIDGQIQLEAWYVSETGGSISLLKAERPGVTEYGLSAEGDSWLILVDDRRIEVERGVVPGWSNVRPSETPGTYIIGGWGADLSAQVPADQILFFVDGVFQSAVKPDRETRRTANEFNMPGILKSAFRHALTVPEDTNPGELEVRIFALSRSGKASELNYPKSSPSWVFKQNPVPSGPAIKPYH